MTEKIPTNEGDYEDELKRVREEYDAKKDTLDAEKKASVTEAIADATYLKGQGNVEQAERALAVAKEKLK